MEDNNYYYGCQNCCMYHIIIKTQRRRDIMQKEKCSKNKCRIGESSVRGREGSRGGEGCRAKLVPTKFDCDTRIHGNLGWSNTKECRTMDLWWIVGTKERRAEIGEATSIGEGGGLDL